MRKDKNYTLYLLTGICAVLIIPIAAVIVHKVQAGIVAKTVMIMIVFILLLIAVLLLYKNIFDVSVQEIAQEEKVTELDRLGYNLTELCKQHRNQRFKKCMDTAMEQMLTFRRRTEVLLQITGSGSGTGEGAIGSVIQSVEDVLIHNIRRLINRAEIFDDLGSSEIMMQNIGYMEELLFKNSELLKDFEKLITEASLMGEKKDNTDVDKLRDVIDAMKTLRNDSNDEIDELANKYK